MEAVAPVVVAAFHVTQRVALAVVAQRRHAAVAARLLVRLEAITSVPGAGGIEASLVAVAVADPVGVAASWAAVRVVLAIEAVPEARRVVALRVAEAVAERAPVAPCVAHHHVVAGDASRVGNVVALVLFEVLVGLRVDDDAEVRLLEAHHSDGEVARGLRRGGGCVGAE
eukprot:scaffold128054_cov51-Phaeocystis_antarctica.AAC.1